MASAAYTTETLGVVTRKGQVTIPAQARKLLGIQEGDRVSFVLEGRTLKIIPVSGSITARTSGLLKGKGPRLSSKELHEAAEIAIAEDVAERMKARAASVS